MANYKVGDHVEYRPIGGAADNVSHTEGKIVGIKGSGEDTRYEIQNDSTGKVTGYHEMNIVRKK